MPHADFQLVIEASEIEKYYRGHVRNVIVRASNGLNIQFPANLLLPFVDRIGVSGSFRLRYDHNGKVIELLRLSR
jgi:uncharacterized protein DUF2835